MIVLCGAVRSAAPGPLCVLIAYVVGDTRLSGIPPKSAGVVLCTMEVTGWGLVFVFADSEDDGPSKTTYFSVVPEYTAGQVLSSQHKRSLWQTANLLPPLT